MSTFRKLSIGSKLVLAYGLFAANDTGAAASQVLASAGDLSTRAKRLALTVHAFTAGVRAA